jgi:hypothetical protein
MVSIHQAAEKGYLLGNPKRHSLLQLRMLLHQNKPQGVEHGTRNEGIDNPGTTSFAGGTKCGTFPFNVAWLSASFMPPQPCAASLPKAGLAKATTITASIIATASSKRMRFKRHYLLSPRAGLGGPALCSNAKSVPGLERCPHDPYGIHEKIVRKHRVKNFISTPLRQAARRSRIP